MPLLEFEHLQPDGSTRVFSRSGYCCRCGDCCKGDPGGIDKEPQVEGYCPLYKLLQNGEGHCSNRQHPYYLKGCVEWPTHPDQLLDKPNCTYEFTEWLQEH